VNRAILLPLAFISFLLPVNADVQFIGGSTSGVFTSPTNGSAVTGHQWRYDGTDGYLTFTGVSAFSGSTPSSFYFGDLTLLNSSGAANHDFEAHLNVTIHFTLPGGQDISFDDALRMDAKPGGGRSGHGDTLDLTGLPDPKYFTAGGETYTVTYDGFFASNSAESGALQSLFIPNNPGGSQTAYLWGSVISAPPSCHIASNPEPGSLLLMTTVAAGVLLAVRPKRSFRPD